MEERIRKILSRMTLEDKISLCNGADFWHSKAMDQYGIPSITMSDGPHGMRVQQGDTDMFGINDSEPATCFPTAVTSGASWDPDLLEEEGKAIGEEGLSYGVDVVLGPGVNIKRDPRCGRNFEYFSEDPYLSGKMGTAWVRGAEGTGIGTSLKHFAANSQEYKRFNGNSQVDERTLREIYLPAFEAAVKDARPATVMNAYPMINGVHCSDSRFLLNDILRKEWGFEGLVVTDWGALCDRVKAIEAGCDLSMPGGSDYMEDRVAVAVREGKLPESAVDACAARVIRLSLLSGQRKKNRPFDAEGHHDTARRVAEAGAVLLKNEDHILPLKAKDIVLIGDMAKTMRYQGSGSSHINPKKLISLCDALPDVPFIACCSEKGEVTNLGLAEAAEAARNAEIAVVCAGLPDIYESEGFDRTDLNMPEGHLRMIETVANANPNTVVVLFCGCAVEVPWINKVKAVLYMGLPGQAGGQAAADLLTGKVSPSGHLTETWPLALSDVPSYETFGKKYTCYSEGLYVGYRYYESSGIPVRFPFGYGLSYTEFEYSDMKISNHKVTAKITNIGSVSGAEVVQLYIMPPHDGLYRPAKELKGFVKIYLEPGESKEACFELDERSFAVWSEGWKVPGGVYTIGLGASVKDIRLCETITIDGTIVPVPAWQKGSWYENPHGKPVKSDFEALFNRPVMTEPEIKKGHFTMEMSTMEMKDSSPVMNMMFRITEKTIAKSFGGKVDYSDPAFKMMVMSGADAPLRATVLSSGGMFPANVAEGLLELANGHYAKGAEKLGKIRRQTEKKTSFAHRTLNSILMKKKTVYDPKTPKNYSALRKAEIDSVRMIRLPKQVTLLKEQLGGIPAEWLEKENNPSDRIVLYIHGGGFVTGSSEARRNFTSYIADKIGLNVVSIDYRLAPEHPFPAGCEDCLQAYKALLEQFEGKKIILLGESAGGNLVLSLLLNIRTECLPMPAAVFSLSPTVQYDRVLDSYIKNKDTDSILSNLSDEVLDVYLQSHDDAVVRNPLASPYYGDYTECPPVVLWVSDSEILRDDSLLMFERLQKQGVPCRLYMRSGMMHSWLILPFLPEAKKDLKVLGDDMHKAFSGVLKGTEDLVIVR
ncbi:MAG: glycoside hydrolase family 3 C-terminal domain-containing protein [Solobacterium sp.]|nr:glycoside hydrolase family 3 C-terminal domain-containing protein [Solobacterium sp.]